MVRELSFEIPLSALTPSGFPAPLLRRAEALRFIRLTTREFLIMCRIPGDEKDDFLAGMKEQFEQVRIDRTTRRGDGSTVFLLSGRWEPSAKGAAPTDSLGLETLRSLEREPGCAVSLRVSDETLRVRIIGEQATIARTVEALRRLSVDHKVLGLTRVKAEGESLLDTLTMQQLRVLRLAQASGYYDLPRRVTTEQLARRLRLDKGTVGEHLRRAERRVMEGLMSDRS